MQEVEDESPPCTYPLIDDDDVVEDKSALGLTDLEKAYRDILNEPISPTTIGGLKSSIRAFKH